MSSQKNDAMVVYGRQVLAYLIDKHPGKIREFYTSKRLDGRILEVVKQLEIPVTKINSRMAQSIAGGGNHQGYIALVDPIDLCPLKEVKLSNSIIVACGIDDVGNLGSIARSSFAMGVDALVITDRNNVSKRVMEGMVRSSSGALFDISLCFVKNSLDVVSELSDSGFDLICTGAGAENVMPNVGARWALFLGNENTGLKLSLVSKLNKTHSIKMYSGFNSLNVAVAAGILIDRIKHRTIR